MGLQAGPKNFMLGLRLRCGLPTPASSAVCSRLSAASVLVMTPPRARPWIAGLSRTPPSSWPRVAAPARTDSVLAGTRHSAIREPPGSPALAAWRGGSGACAALGIWHWRASAGSRATSPSIFGLVRRFHARLLDLQPPPRPAALCTRSTDQASIEATSLAPFHCRQLPGLLHSRSPPPRRRLPRRGSIPSGLHADLPLH